MGSWRFDSDPVSEQDRSKFIADAAKSMSNDIPSNAPPAWLQNKLCDVLFRDYIPGGSTNLPGHGDFEEAAKVLSKYLLSAMGNKIGVTQDVSRLSYSQKSILAREHESSIEHQTVELLKSYLEESQSPYTVDREKANRQIFADLLKITTEDKIQAFGNELKRHDYFARNNAVAAIQKLKEQGVFDDKLEMDFRKVLKSDTECYMFADKFGSVDISEYGRSVENSANVPDILKAIAEDRAMAQGLYNALCFGNHPVPWVHAQTDTGYLVKALIRAPAGTVILGCSRLMRYEEYWKLWAEINGVQLVVQVDEEFHAAGAPDWFAREIYESKLYVSKYGWAGGDPNVKNPEEVGVEMDKLMGIERYMRETEYAGFM